MTDDGPTSTVRVAADDELVDVMRVLDGAVLEIDAETVETRLGTDAVLVAERDGHIIGALVRDGDHVDAVAVRRQHRADGVGSALVRAALERTDRLTADFDPRVRQFYESLGFEITERDGRLWAEKHSRSEER
ncbi:GNAT family N-acetyltransferase [Haloprofundus salilacus]|uniref:GNAT family N-acetyltransferase n=1 Tax=Haloprofundus salilacus TaxID=2876190 RepID=UPI00295F30FE|nr:GNAT family N-acetyltransferase [Haloprofundus salilacus]